MGTWWGSSKNHNTKIQDWRKHQHKAKDPKNLRAQLMLSMKELKDLWASFANDRETVCFSRRVSEKDRVANRNHGRAKTSWCWWRGMIWRFQCPFWVWGLMVWLLNAYRGPLHVYMIVNVWSTEIWGLTGVK